MYINALFWKYFLLFIYHLILFLPGVQIVLVTQRVVVVILRVVVAAAAAAAVLIIRKVLTGYVLIDQISYLSLRINSHKILVYHCFSLAVMIMTCAC